MKKNEPQQNADYYSNKSDDLYNYDPGCDFMNNIFFVLIILKYKKIFPQHK